MPRNQHEFNGPVDPPSEEEAEDLLKGATFDDELDLILEGKVTVNDVRRHHNLPPVETGFTTTERAIEANRAREDGEGGE